MEKEITVTFRNHPYRASIQIIIAARFDGSKAYDEHSKEFMQEKEFVKRLTEVAHELAPIAEEKIKTKMQS
jgi:hypothetical protein